MHLNRGRGRARRGSALVLGVALLIGIAAAPAAAAVPGAPAQPSVSAGNGQITVTFAAPFSNGGRPITKYTASCAPIDPDIGTFAQVSNAGAVAPIIVAGLTNGAGYTCSVHATNADGVGNESPDSAGVVVGAPATPSQPIATAGHAQISAAFTPPANNGSPITSYTASCTSSTGNAGSNTGAASPIVISPLTNGASYTCIVTAFNALGSSGPSAPSAPVTPFVSAPGAPAAPTAARGDTKIGVVFSPPADNGGSPITSYSATCTSFSGAPGTNTGAASPITVTGLTNGASYTCTVSATNALGTSPASPPSASVVPAPVPDAPPRPTVVARTGAITVSFTAPADNGTPITGYTATCVSLDGGVPAAQSGTTSPITVVGLSNKRTYTCTVLAISAVGAGPPSPPSIEVVPTTVPAPPTLRGAGPRDGAAIVSFTPNTSAGLATSFKVGCTSSNAGAPGLIGGATSPITVPGLSNGKIYTCTVRASNSIGTSAPSAVSRAFIVGTPGAPTIAHVVSSATLAPRGTLNITFNPGPANGSTVTGYRATCIQDVTGATTVNTGASSPIAVGNLLTGHGYTCSVVATNSRGTGPASNAVHSIVGTPSVAPITHVFKIRSGVVLSFVPPISTGGGILSYYQMRCSSTNGGVTTSTLQLVSPIVANNLTVGRTYTCALSAVNGRGAGAPNTTAPFLVLPTQPAQICHGATGLLKATPGLQLAFAQAQSFGLTATLGSCSGPYVQQAKASLSFRSAAISCQTAVGASGTGSATFTWTAPAGLGSASASIKFVIASSAGHATLATFHGTVTSRQNMFSSGQVSGTVILNRGLAGVGAGGDCPPSGRLTSLGVTAFSLTIT